MKFKHLGLHIAAPALLAGLLLTGLPGSVLNCLGQSTLSAVTAAPPPGEIWVYPTGVFPDDFYSLWLAINGVPYASGDLPVPYYNVSDDQPGARPVFVGSTLPNGKMTVILKARRLVTASDGSYVQGGYTAFNLGLAAGTQLTKSDPIPPVNYLLTTDTGRYSTGFGVVLLRRSIEVRGELIPGGQEGFFGYTPNFDPLANPDTNPDFQATWLPASYPRGAEFEAGRGYGIKSAKSVIYGGNMAFTIYDADADLSVSDCLLYGQYGTAMSDINGPNKLLVRNVDIVHTYHCHQVVYKNDVGLFTWAINIQNILGGGGERLIEGCHIDQEPTWQEYYFGANPRQGRYNVGAFPGGHAVYIDDQGKAAPGDSVIIRRSTLKNCGSNVLVYDTSNVDLLVEDCVIDGGYFPVPSKDSPSGSWRGNCIVILAPSTDAWGASPAINIAGNDLIPRGNGAWGARLFGCANGEVTVEDNNIVCAEAGLNFAGGVQLQAFWTEGSNRNKVLSNTISGTGSWAMQVNAPYLVTCEGNEFLDNDLSDFSTQQAGAVYFGPLANYNIFRGDPGAGIVDLGTGNIIQD